MMLTTEVVTDNIPNVPTTSEPVKKPSSRKSLCIFTNVLDVKQKTAKRLIVAAKSKRRAMKVGNSQCNKKKTKKAFKNQ